MRIRDCSRKLHRWLRAALLFEWGTMNGFLLWAKIKFNHGTCDIFDLWYIFLVAFVTGLGAIFVWDEASSYIDKFCEKHRETIIKL